MEDEEPMSTTLIVSDIHLGARNSQGEALAELLHTDFDRLILNGDTVDHLNFRRFRGVDWAVLAQLRRIARERELILIRGNHDGDRRTWDYELGPLDVLAELLEADLREEYVLRVGRRRYLILHGDQFDRTLNLTWVGDAADSCYRMVQSCSRPFARWLKGRVKQWGGVIRHVRHGAFEHARRHRCDGIITGHTHFFEEAWLDGIHYLNTGCWVDWPCTYLQTTGETIRLCHWTGAAAIEQPVLQEPVAADLDAETAVVSFSA
jgi:UDP-2,3-diacylglucosamine pyrophosphatase LpxH